MERWTWTQVLASAYFRRSVSYLETSIIYI